VWTWICTTGEFPEAQATPVMILRSIAWQSVGGRLKAALVVTSARTSAQKPNVMQADKKAIRGNDIRLFSNLLQAHYCAVSKAAD